VTERHVRLVLPHQLFASHVDAPAGTTFVLVEHDLLFRQYRFHQQKSDLPTGDWTEDWDALYWTFVRDHHDVFAGNPRSQMVARLYDRMDTATKAAHTRRARRWLA
jgi:deoxyribodipyrimidine photolyase-like uncharacterized protein